MEQMTIEQLYKLHINPNADIVELHNFYKTFNVNQISIGHPIEFEYVEYHNDLAKKYIFENSILKLNEMNQKQMLKIIQATTSGKKIEFTSKKSNEGNWIPISENHYFNFDIFLYRIEQKKFVPFTYKDRNEIIGKVVKLKNNSVICLINMVNPIGIEVGSIFYDFAESFEKLEFENGEIFGFKITDYITI
jgi:hypothetical protein